MNTPTPLDEALQIVGPTALARGLGLSPKAVRKWKAAGRLPRTEWTGETRYAERIEQLTGGKVPAARMLQPWPRPTADSTAAGAPA
jgi:hypothetical protein